MHRFYSSLLFTLLVSTNTNGQPPPDLRSTVGKKFVSRTLEYMEIVNNTTLYSSINFYTDTARFFLSHDTLFIKQKYLQTDQKGTKYAEKLYDYKVIALAADSIQLKNNFRLDYKPTNWEDTLVFINIEKLKEPVAALKLLKLDYSSPLTGRRHITIDSLGKVSFIDEPIPYSIRHPEADKNAKPKNIRGELTQKEFIKFKNLLSMSLPSKLPPNRGCPMDAAISSFEILIGTKKITSIGCDFSWIHTILFDYVYDIDQNKALVNKTN
jgi:hypothetical protein